MKDKLEKMKKKPGYAEYRLTTERCLDILGEDHKVADNYFLYDGKHYYFGNSLVKLSNTEDHSNNLILAMTNTKLLIPQDNNEYWYITRNSRAESSLYAVVLYYYNNFIHYTVVNGNGSGLIRPIELPFNEDGYLFCFHLAIEAIATVNPELAETLYTDIKRGIRTAQAKITEEEVKKLFQSS